MKRFSALCIYLLLFGSGAISQRLTVFEKATVFRGIMDWATSMDIDEKDSSSIRLFIMLHDTLSYDSIHILRQDIVDNFNDWIVKSKYERKKYHHLYTLFCYPGDSVVTYEYEHVLKGGKGKIFHKKHSIAEKLKCLKFLTKFDPVVSRYKDTLILTSVVLGQWPSYSKNILRAVRRVEEYIAIGVLKKRQRKYSYIMFDIRDQMGGSAMPVYSNIAEVRARVYKR